MSNKVYRLSIHDNRYDRQWYVGEAVEEVQWTTYLEGQPGKLVFYVHKTDGVAFWEGATVWFTVDGELVFRGIVFKKERSQNVDLIKVTAYDYLIYLKNKDAFVFQEKTLPEIFEEVCVKFDLNFNVVDSTDYQCVDRIFDNRTGRDVLQTSIDDTFANSGNWFCLRSINNEIQLHNTENLLSNIQFGDASAIISFNYTTSIDDSYNQIKLYRDNQDTGRREIYIVRDSDTINEWGLLQYYSPVNDTLNTAQIEERATSILGAYNRRGRQFKCTECLGDLSVFSGAIIKCSISDLGDISLDDNLLIQQCTHTFSESYHSMSFLSEIYRSS